MTALNENGAAPAQDDATALGSILPAASAPEADPRFSYIQLRQHGKVPTPAMDGWTGRPRYDIATVRSWVAEGFNLGVCTGERSGAWVLDVDIDVRTGEPSPEWAALFAEHGLPATYTVKSPSGGLHYYFRLPEGVEVRNDQGKVIAPGVDIRGTGGYVVAPGCFASYDKHGVHFEGRYEVIDGSPIGPTPTWVVDRLRAREERQAQQVARASVAEVAPKAENIDPEHDKMARAELNALFAKVEALVALPEGERLEILGAPRGWEDGSGFLTLACAIIEVARWPLTSVTVEDARAAWIERVQSTRDMKYVVREWERALEVAGPTWAYGDGQVGAASLMGSVPSRSEGQTTSWGEPDIGGEMRDRMRGDEDDDTLWIKHKNGTKSLDIPEAASRVRDAEGASMLTDASGGLWVYRDGAFVLDERHVGRALIGILDRLWTPAHVNNVKQYIRTTADLLDFNEVAHPGLVNFRNGMVDWRTGDKVDHDPAYQSTFQVNADWDPEADCPLFARYVDTMLEPEAAALLWEVIGYSMLPGNPMQVFVFFEGPGGNGKGVVQRVLNSLLGPGNVSSLSMADIDGDNRFKLSRMVGRAANISGETPKTHIHDSSNLKAVTGGDWVDVERKGVDGVQVRIHALPIFSVNEVPSLGDDSEGLFQRAVVIPFHRSSNDHRIEGFDEGAFKGELAGIARRGLEAVRAVRFDSPSLRANGFTLGTTGERARRNFREQANSELDWVNNHLAPAGDHWMKPMELYRAYGGRGERVTRKFMNALRERFGEPSKAVPSSVANHPMTQDHPAKNARVLCYGVRVSEDRIDPVRDLFGVPSEVAS